MIKKYNINNRFTWVNVTSPDAGELADLPRIIPVHPIIHQELSTPSDRSKVESYGSYLFLVYHLPLYNPHGRTSRKAEVDFVVSHDTLITVSYEPLEPLEQFIHAIATRTEDEVTSTAHLVYHIIRLINEFSLRELRHIEGKVASVGARIFAESSYTLLEDVSYVRRDILNFSIIAAPQRVTLESLSDTGTTFWGKEYRVYFTDLLGEFLKTHYLLENLRATVESYGDTVSQILDFKATQVMRRFTILGFLTFPLLLYSTIALEPTVAGTFIRSASDFWMVFSIIASFIALLAIVLRKKNVL